jgi:hypothetical protein
MPAVTSEDRPLGRHCVMVWGIAVSSFEGPDMENQNSPWAELVTRMRAWRLLKRLPGAPKPPRESRQRKPKATAWTGLVDWQPSPAPRVPAAPPPAPVLNSTTALYDRDDALKALNDWVSHTAYSIIGQRGGGAAMPAAMGETREYIRWCHHNPDAEDVAQEMRLTIWRYARVPALLPQYMCAAKRAGVRYYTAKILNPRRRLPGLPIETIELAMRTAPRHGGVLMAPAYDYRTGLTTMTSVKLAGRWQHDPARLAGMIDSETYTRALGGLRHLSPMERGALLAVADKQPLKSVARAFGVGVTAVSKASKRARLKIIDLIGKNAATILRTPLLYTGGINSAMAA